MKTKDVIAGQGTAGLEFLEDAAALNLPLDRMVVCVGGGGLIAGCALAGRVRDERTEFFSAEPYGYDDTLRSLRIGARVRNDMGVPCTADALMTATPGELTFSLNRELLAGGFTVSDQQIAAAVRFLSLFLINRTGGIEETRDRHEIPLQSTLMLCDPGGKWLETDDV